MSYQWKKKGFCNECTDKITCKRCISQFNENKEFEVNLNLWKRQPPDKNGYIFPYFKEKDEFFVKVLLLYDLLSFFF